MAGRGIRGGGGKVTPISAARKAKDDGDRKDDGAPKNNLQAIREAEQAQLLSIMAKLRPAVAKVEAAKAAVKDAQAGVTEILDHAQAAGFKKGEIRELLKDSAVTGTRKDLREAEERRARFREYLGLPVGAQGDLLDRMPEAAKDELDWRGHGYTAGLRADKRDPKEFGVPERFWQTWMQEYDRGQETNAWSLSPEGKERPKPQASTAPQPADEPEKQADDFETPAEELARQTSRPSTIEASDPGAGEDGGEAV